MATTITGYNQLSHIIANHDMDALDLRLALVTSAYTFAATHTLWSDASGSEVATGAGYTTGGATIAGEVLSLSTSQTMLDATDVTWAALTKTFRRAVCYASGTVIALTNPLLFSVLFNDAPADIVIAAVDYSVRWNDSGMITVGA